MHRPAEAAQELRRAVNELGLVGAILNDWQATEEFDGNGIMLFDGMEFDPFWEVVQELDVPVYFHPKVFESLFKDCSFPLVGDTLGGMLVSPWLAFL